MASILLMISGIFLDYTASQKTILQKHIVTDWLRQHRVFSKVTGWGITLSAIITTIIQYGFGAGILIASVLWMIITSLLVILYPIKSDARK